MDKKNEIVYLENCIGRLEEISLNMEYLAAIAHVCGAGFNDKNMFGYVNNWDVCNAFDGINKQIEDAESDLSNVIWQLRKYMRGEADMEIPDLNRMKAEIMGEQKKDPE